MYYVLNIYIIWYAIYKVHLYNNLHNNANEITALRLCLADKIMVMCNDSQGYRDDEERGGYIQPHHPHNIPYFGPLNIT